MRKNGFTLIELIVVVALIGIMTAIGSNTFLSYSRTQKLQTAANDLVTIFNVAKSNSLSQVKNPTLCLATDVLSGYRVVISNSTCYSLYAVCGGDKVVSSKFLPGGITISSGTPTSFFFPILTGGVSGSGGTTAIAGYGQTRCVKVDSAGLITQHSPPCQTAAPIGGTTICGPAPTPTPTPTPTSTPTPTPTPTPGAPTSTPTPTPTPVGLPSKYVFVTSVNTYNGNLGGLTGGDTKCKTLADAAGSLVPGRTWKAWLSDTATNAIDRIADGKFIRVGDSALIGNSKADLIDCTNPSCIVNSISNNEKGLAVSAQGVWTGTNSDGTKAGTTCSSWATTSSLISGKIGGTSQTNANWTTAADRICSSTGALYCFEQ